MKVLIIDNYDSFTYNLYQFIGEILSVECGDGQFDVIVKRNDELTLEEVKTLAADRIIISPGPGNPEDVGYFGVCADVIAELGKTTPLLGVCLGMQGITHVFGGRVVKARLPMHGKVSPITHDGTGIFQGIPDQLEVMRYHSLVAEPDALPDCLRLTAIVGELPAVALDEYRHMNAGKSFEIMGIQHRDYPITGIQFHPESFATEGGKELIKNFLFGA